MAVPASDRARLEQLCRYLLRPAVAQDRLRLLADGRISKFGVSWQVVPTALIEMLEDKDPERSQRA